MVKVVRCTLKIYINLNEKSGSSDFFKFFSRTEIKLISRKMELNEYSINCKIILFNKPFLFN